MIEFNNISLFNFVERRLICFGTAERRLKLMKFLCQRRHETIINLSKEFNVSVRTIQRDIDEISDMLPIYVKTGRYNGGVYVVDGFNFDKMYMSDNEIALLEKVRETCFSGAKLSLNLAEKDTLNKIIINYSKPAV